MQSISSKIKVRSAITVMHNAPVSLISPFHDEITMLFDRRNSTVGQDKFVNSHNTPHVTMLLMHLGFFII